MHDTHNNEELEEEFSGPSKSAVKRQMIALQDMGEKLTQLTEKQLQKIPIEDERLVIAVGEARLIKSNSARKRHMQYIGKLMRDIDAEPIQKALQVMHQQKQQTNDKFHALETLRSEVLDAGLKGIELVIAKWPHADRQQLRQLVLQHQRELKNNRPPTASRKLFKYLRELQDY